MRGVRLQQNPAISAANGDVRHNPRPSLIYRILNIARCRFFRSGLAVSHPIVFGLRRAPVFPPPKYRPTDGIFWRASHHSDMVTISPASRRVAILVLALPNCVAHFRGRIPHAVKTRMGDSLPNPSLSAKSRFCTCDLMMFFATSYPHPFLFSGLGLFCVWTNARDSLMR